MVVSICFKLRIKAIEWNLVILCNVLCFLEAENSIFVNVNGIQFYFGKILINMMVQNWNHRTITDAWNKYNKNNYFRY